MSSDTARLRFLMADGCVEGFVGVEKDRHEYAYDVSVEEGREEPNGADELEGFRRLIDAAILLPNNQGEQLPTTDKGEKGWASNRTKQSQMKGGRARPKR